MAINHSQYLKNIERVWARYESRRNSLVLYLQTSARLPALWVRNCLRIQACDPNGNHLRPLAIVWQNVNGSPLHGEAVCPSEFQPSDDKPFIIRIGDFVLHAGDCERVLPNGEPPLHRAPTYPREDRRL